jgi:hypothetical protein
LPPDSKSLPPLATAELEGLLFSPETRGRLSHLKPAADSWTVQFPDLTSLPRPAGQSKPLSICIATEDIVGPVRNGGIGSTYAALAAALAKAGHQVTILYLRGGDVEIGALEQWIEHYAELSALERQGVSLANIVQLAAAARKNDAPG